MKDNKAQRLQYVRWGMAAVLAVAMIIAWAPARHWLESRGEQTQDGETPEAEARESLSQGSALAAGAILDQTLTYTPCGHEVQRRVEAPATWVGKERAAVERELADYRVTAFAPSLVEMRRDLALFCPAHWVIKPDKQGEVCIWQNVLGEAMECLSSLGIGVEDLPESEREQVRQGLAFDSQQDMELWLEAMDS